MSSEPPQFAPRPLPPRKDGKSQPTYRAVRNKSTIETLAVPRKGRTSAICFENPANGYREYLNPRAAFWGCTFFGCFYFIIKGV